MGFPCSCFRPLVHASTASTDTKFKQPVDALQVQAACTAGTEANRHAQSRSSQVCTGISSNAQPRLVDLNSSSGLLQALRCTLSVPAVLPSTCFPEGIINQIAGAMEGVACCAGLLVLDQSSMSWVVTHSAGTHAHAALPPGDVISAAGASCSTWQEAGFGGVDDMGISSLDHLHSLCGQGMAPTPLFASIACTGAISSSSPALKACLPPDWRSAHVQCGFTHFAALPLQQAGELQGVLVMYAAGEGPMWPLGQSLGHLAAGSSSRMLLSSQGISIRPSTLPSRGFESPAIPHPNRLSRHACVSLMCDPHQLLELAHHVEMSLFSSATAATYAKLACMSLLCIHAAPTLTEMLAAVCSAASTMVEALHHVDMSACAALAGKASAAYAVLLPGTALAAAASAEHDTMLSMSEQSVAMGTLGCGPLGAYRASARGGSSSISGPRPRVSDRSWMPARPTMPQLKAATVAAVTSGDLVTRVNSSPGAMGFTVPSGSASANANASIALAAGGNRVHAYRLRDTVLSSCLAAVRSDGQVHGTVVADCASTIRTASMLPKDLLILPDTSGSATACQQPKQQHMPTADGMVNSPTSSPFVRAHAPMLVPACLVVIASPLNTHLHPHCETTPTTSTQEHLPVLGLYLYCSIPLPPKLLAAVQANVEDVMRMLVPALSRRLAHGLMADVCALLAAALETTRSGAATPVQLSVHSLNAVQSMRMQRSEEVLMVVNSGIQFPDVNEHARVGMAGAGGTCISQGMHARQGPVDGAALFLKTGLQQPGRHGTAASHASTCSALGGSLLVDDSVGSLTTGTGASNPLLHASSRMASSRHNSGFVAMQAAQQAASYAAMAAETTAREGSVASDGVYTDDLLLSLDPSMPLTRHRTRIGSGGLHGQQLSARVNTGVPGAGAETMSGGDLYGRLSPAAAGGCVDVQEVMVSLAEADNGSSLQTQVDALYASISSALTQHAAEAQSHLQQQQHVSEALTASSPRGFPRTLQHHRSGSFGSFSRLSRQASAAQVPLHTGDASSATAAGGVLVEGSAGPLSDLDALLLHEVFDYPHVPSHDKDAWDLEEAEGSSDEDEWAHDIFNRRGSVSSSSHVCPHDRAKPIAAASASARRLVVKKAAREKLHLQRLRVREMVERAAMELAVCSTLHHPHIVQVYAHYTRVRLRNKGKDPGAGPFVLAPASNTAGPPSLYSQVCLALVMEMCDMGGVDRILAKTSRLGKTTREGVYQPNLCNVLLCLVELALALKHLHAHNIAHCDVKPGNLMAKSSARDPRGFTCKLADFGFAKLLTPGKGPGGRPGIVPEDASGTLVFMAPELFVKDRSIDWSVDIYALGITMHMLYTGSLPYPGLEGKQLPKAVVGQGVRPEMPRSAPEAYRSLAARCWSRDPLARPSAAQVAHTLSALLQQLWARVQQ